MPTSYFIYYRVAVPEQALELVQQIQATIKDMTGIDGRLLQKRGDPATWMEIYEGVVDGNAFEQHLAAADLDFTRVLAPGAKRNVECFEEPCA